MHNKIGYLTGEYPRATDTFIQREVQALRNHGMYVQTFAIRKPPADHNVGEEQIREREQTHYILPCSPLKLIVANLSLLFKSPLRYVSAFWLAIKTSPPGIKALIYQLFYFIEAALLVVEIKKQNITHLHNHFANSSCSVAMIAAELGAFTYSFTIHGPAIFFEPNRWRLDEKIKRALFVSCISHFCRSQVMIWAKPEKYDRLHIVHCGVDINLIHTKTHAGRGARLLYVGRIAAVKGLPILLQSLANLKSTHPDIKLTVVGDGPDRAMLEQMTNELELSNHVKFLGYQSQAEVRNHLQNADTFVMSSYAEGVPVVLMEAMAAGVPVIATRIAGVAELVEHDKSGYIVNPGDCDSLSAAIESLLGDADLRNQFGAVGRKRVELQFNIDLEANWLMQIMTAAFDGKKSSIRPKYSINSLTTSSDKAVK